MEQKITWMHFLIIGISLISIAYVGCSKTIVDSVKTVSYSYANDTDEGLTMEVYNKFGNLIEDYNIGIGLNIISNTTKSEVPSVFHYASFENRIGDSIAVKFTSNKCLFFTKENGDRIFTVSEYDNYSEELLNQKKYSLRFTFKQSDIEQAVDCN